MATGACGFIFSHGPPEGHEQMDYFVCTESNAGPIIGPTCGGLLVFAALSAAADPGLYDLAYYSNSGDIAVVLSSVALYGVPAGVSPCNPGGRGARTS